MSDLLEFDAHRRDDVFECPKCTYIGHLSGPTFIRSWDGDREYLSYKCPDCQYEVRTKTADAERAEVLTDPSQWGLPAR